VILQIVGVINAALVFVLLLVFLWVVFDEEGIEKWLKKGKHDENAK